MAKLVTSPEGIPIAEGRDMLALPGDGRVVYRLVRHDPPTKGDFQPRYNKSVADLTGLPELLRIGVSHYATLEDIRPWQTEPGSMIARVTLSERSYFARTSPVAGHLDVWARVEDLVSSAEIVE
jgi:hypothetical protein